MPTRRAFLQSALFLPSLLAADAFAQDAAKTGAVTFADFEGANWNDWTIEGEAFGAKPATEALFPGKIRGFGGNGFVCTLHPRKGNAATGKAVSKEFTIEKPFITFRIGGGNPPSQACLNLVIDGQPVRTATGDGTPNLSESSFDVSALLGKKAHLEIVDATASADRGYIIVDDIQFTERPDNKIQSWLDEYIRAYQSENDIPGVWVAISVGGVVKAQSAVGRRKFDDGTPASINDKIMVGSISKPMTNTMIGALIQQGVMRWDMTFAEVFPNYAAEISNSAMNAPLWRLLNHTSGLDWDKGTPGKKGWTPTRWRLENALNMFRVPPLGQPGAVFSYGGGAVVASAMAEKLTGVTYEDLMKKYVYVPSGMKSTGMGLPGPESVPPSFPRGHYKTGNKTMLNTEENDWRNLRWDAAPSGSIHCSIVDLVSFGNLFLGSRSQINPELLKASPDDKCTRGGWFIYRKGLFTHGGDTHRGEEAQIWLDTNNKICVAFYRNVEFKEKDPQAREQESLSILQGAKRLLT